MKYEEISGPAQPMNYLDIQSEYPWAFYTTNTHGTLSALPYNSLLVSELVQPSNVSMVDWYIEGSDNMSWVDQTKLIDSQHRVPNIAEIAWCWVWLLENKWKRYHGIRHTKLRTSSAFNSEHLCLSLKVNENIDVSVAEDQATSLYTYLSALKI